MISLLLLSLSLSLSLSRTMSELSTENIEFIENYITTKPPLTYLPSLSYPNVVKANRAYETITKPDVPSTTYIYFASNPNGYSRYGYYKSRGGEIYLLTEFLNEICGYNTAYTNPFHG